MYVCMFWYVSDLFVLIFAVAVSDEGNADLGIWLASEEISCLPKRKGGR